MNRKALVFAFLLAVAILTVAACDLTPTPPPPTATTVPSPTPAPAVTIPPPATPTPIPGNQQTDFTFVACGDNRDGDATYKRLLEMVVADGAAFLVNTGDLVPRGYDFYWENFAELMEGFPIPFFPVPGNHDLHDGALEGFVKWTPNGQPHYSFDWGQLHFTVANDSLGEMSASELAWIDADLSATKQPVKIVAHHHPAWDPDGGDHIMWGGNEAYLALLKKHGVRYDLCGHDHRYRTAERDGTVLITTGGAGAPLYYPPEQGGFHHYVRFTVRGTDVRFEAVKVE
jgi:3',5'-cyclic AMP phosphodiesterase CpdA